MDESALQHRLDAIERRQFLILSLVVGLYLFSGGWLLVDEIAVITVWHVVVGLTVLLLLLSIVGTYRRRRASH